MAFIDIFAWIVLIVIVLSVVAALVVVAMLPGKLARQRNHPQAEAINIAGIAGIFTFGVVWVLALIWAFTKPDGRADDEELAALKARVAALESDKGRAA